MGGGEKGAEREEGPVERHWYNPNARRLIYAAPPFRTATLKTLTAFNFRWPSILFSLVWTTLPHTGTPPHRSACSSRLRQGNYLSSPSLPRTGSARSFRVPLLLSSSCSPSVRDRFLRYRGRYVFKSDSIRLYCSVFSRVMSRERTTQNCLEKQTRFPDRAQQEIAQSFRHFGR